MYNSLNYTNEEETSVPPPCSVRPHSSPPREKTRVQGPKGINSMKTRGEIQTLQPVTTPFAPDIGLQSCKLSFGGVRFVGTNVLPATVYCWCQKEVIGYKTAGMSLLKVANALGRGEFADTIRVRPLQIEAVRMPDSCTIKYRLLVLPDVSSPPLSFSPHPEWPRLVFFPKGGFRTLRM